MAGHAALRVHRKVRLAIAATGDELVQAGTAAGDDRLPETNRLMLMAMLAGLPVEIVDLGILPDNLDTLRDTFRAVDVDLLVTTGGASVGDHDLVRPALEAAGAEIDFWKTALRPGKPVMAGRLGRAVVVGLPGNPVSVFVTTLLFVAPLIAHMAGAADPLPRRRAVPLGEAIPANGERTDYIRAELRDGAAFASTIQDSSMLRTLARAGCLIVREPHAPGAKAGDSVEILDLL
jgi:molybdopterin molybdotransferase